MKKNKVLLSILFLVWTGLSFSQTVVYQEDFEGLTPSITSYNSSGGSNTWGVNSLLFSGGLKSDSAAVSIGDTLFLETNSFSTINNTSILLEFDQICKIDFFDKALIQTSNDNGSSWQDVLSTDYLGTAFMSNHSFSSFSYTTWDVANATTVPNNTWWYSESFDISSLIPNVAQAKIRFLLIDSDNNGSRGNYGWVLDNLKVTASPCELIPPTINLTGTVHQGTVYTTGPYLVEADIVDASGISSAVLTYTINNGNPSTLPMGLQSGNTYEATIPSVTLGDTVCYSIVAIDNSTCLNQAVDPSTGCVQFIVSNSPPPVGCVGQPVSNYNYQESFANFTPGDGQTSAGTLVNGWVNETNDTHDWWVYNFSTMSTNTGPTAAHSTTDANYMYVEATNSFNRTAILNSQCYDFSNLLAPEFSFWYHMYGNTMGELHVDIYFGGQWVLDVMPVIVGDQGNNWLQRTIDLSAYAGSIIQMRFRAITGPNFRSDIAIDDIEIIEPIQNDISVSKVVSPSAFGCSGSANEYVTVELENLGRTTQNEIPLAYRLNNGSVIRDTARINLAYSNKSNHTFQQTINMLTPGNYVIDVWSELPSDTKLNNDTLLGHIVASNSSITIYPDTSFFENFIAGIPGTYFDGWINSSNDTHDWYVNSGGTPSNQTGPTSDYSGSGNYIYVEATNFNNTEAILISKCYDINQLSSPQLSFFYHMSGIEMGELHLDMNLNGVNIPDIITPIIGDQGTNWNQAVLDLTPFKGVVKFSFRANVGNGYRSDISIDEVSVTDLNPVGVNSLTKASEFVVIPNPFKNKLTIDSPNKIKLIEIYNSLGQLVKRQSDNFNNIEVNQISEGSYLLKVTMFSGEQVIKNLIKY